VLTHPAGRHVVLNHREPERGALADEERRGLGPREAPSLRDDPVEHRRKLSVATDGDAELEQVLEHLRAALGCGSAQDLQEAPTPGLVLGMSMSRKG
jgi:hypothetical protein